MKGVSSLKSGGVSVVFHVPHELAVEALAMHEFQDVPINLRIYELREDYGDNR